MLDFRRVWLPQLLGYAELIIDPSILRLAWIEGDRSRTSVIDYHELFQQVFDDLMAKDVLRNLDSYIPENGSMQSSIRDFVLSLSSVEGWIEGLPSHPEPDTLFSSKPWKDLHMYSNNLLQQAHKFGFSSSDYIGDTIN